MAGLELGFALCLFWVVMAFVMLVSSSALRDFTPVFIVRRGWEIICKTVVSRQ
jgi:hypothetical protein